MKRMEIENSFRDLLFILNNTMINLASLKKNTKQSLSKSSKVICCFESMIIPSSSSITQHRGFSTLLSVGSKWNSAWDPKQNVILSPWCSVSSQHISFLFMREPSRNSSIDTQLLDLSIGEPAGEWKFKCILHYTPLYNPILKTEYTSLPWLNLHAYTYTYKKKSDKPNQVCQLTFAGLNKFCLSCPWARHLQAGSVLRGVHANSVWYY